MDKENRSRQEERYIDFRRLFSVLKRGILWILAAAILAGAFGYVYSKQSDAPLYRTTGYMMVKAGEDQKVDSTSAQGQAYLTTLTATYASICKSQELLNTVINDLNLDMDYTALYGRISVSQLENTYIFRITVSDASSETSEAIVKDMIDKAPGILVPIVGEGRIEEVDHPYTNMQAGNAGTRKTVLKAAGTGALLMILALLLLAVLDRTVRGSADVEDALGLTILGVLPREGGAEKTALSLPALPAGRDHRKEEPGQKTAPIVPAHVETEAVRALRTRTSWLLEQRQAGNVLMVTDAEAGGRGEDLAAALAISFARAGRRILLIDTDMHHGTLFKKLGIPDEIAADGLSAWLREEEEDWTRFVLRSKKYGIDFMPAGKASRNSAELLGSERMADLLRYASAEYDLVLCSTAAAGSSADALTLGCLTHAAILAVSHKKRKELPFDAAAPFLRFEFTNFTGSRSGRFPPLPPVPAPSRGTASSCRFLSHRQPGCRFPLPSVHGPSAL